MPRIGEISINVTGKTDNLKRALKDGERATKDFSEKVKRSGDQAERALGAVGRSLSTAQSALVGFVGGLGSGVAMAGLNALAQGVRGLTSAIIDGNAEFERYHMQFKVLLGGAEQAKQRLEELARFGRETPFELGEVVRASKILQSFGGTALATGESLRMVGDAASMAGVSIDELSVWVGRFYGSLKEGKPAGEALQRFRELAIITPEFTKQLNELVRTNGSASEAWRLFVVEMDRAKGLMDEQSKTWDGLWSNMIDQVNEFARVVGKPFFDAAKEGLKEVLDWFNSSQGGQAAQEELKKIAKEAGAVLKEIGPKFFKSASEGLVKFLKWVASEDSKKAIENLAETAKVIGAIYIALKGIEGIKNLKDIFAGLGGMAAGGGIAGGATAAAGGIGAVPLAIGAGSLVLGKMAGDSMAEFHADQARKRQIANGVFTGVDPSKTAFGKVFQDSGNDLLSTLRGTTAAAAGARSALQRDRDQMEAIARANVAKSQATARGPAASGAVSGLSGVILGRTSSGRGGGGGRGGGKAASGPLGDAFQWLWDGIARSFEFARDQVVREWEHFQDFMQDLRTRKMRADGATEASLLADMFQQGTHPVSDPASQSKMLAGLVDVTAHEARLRNTQQFTQAKKQEVQAMREWAKELGAESAVAKMIADMGNAQNVISFGFFKQLTGARLSEIAAIKKRSEATESANVEARQWIATAKEEMGVTKAATEQQKMLFEVMFGKFRSVSGAVRGQLLDVAREWDLDKQLKEKMKPLEEQTKRYNDTLRDLALRLSLVGASSEEARMQLELLSQGMSVGQAESIIGVQRMINELEHLRGISERTADGLATALLDSFSQIRNGAGAMFSTLVQGFRQTLAEMAQEYLRSMIRDILKNFIFSVFKVAAPSGGGMQGWLNTGNDGNLWQSAPSAPGSPSAPVVVNMTVNTPDAGGFRRAQGQIAQEMITQAARAQRRNG